MIVTIECPLFCFSLLRFVLHFFYCQQAHSLLTLLQEHEGIQPEQQRLIYKGKTMSDTRTAESYDITDGCTLHLVLALRGG